MKLHLPRRRLPAGAPQPCLVLLAAGRSRRLGRPKGALVARGAPLLVHQLRKARTAGLNQALVVLGAAAPRLETLLSPSVRVALGFQELHVLRARAWREGMGGSLRDGLRALPADCSHVLVLLVDQTGISADHLRRLARVAGKQRVVATTATAGVPMAPVVLPRRYLRTAIDRLQGDRGLGPWLRALETGHRVDVPCPAASQDLDTPEDAAVWRSSRTSSPRP